jgi:trimeric autotransporter adhesin
MVVLTRIAVSAVAVFAVAATTATGAVTPGWECVPATPGKAVTSGGTGTAPSCASGTPVLAPTYVAAGVGGRPTAEFSAVNVQIVSGSGATSGPVNGEGNLIVGYAENANGFSQAGSNDLVVGTNNGWGSYGQIVGGIRNQGIGAYATAVGMANRASGLGSFVTGDDNAASAAQASVSGGAHNTASGGQSSVTGGAHNTAKGSPSTVTGGNFNLASDDFSAVVGGCENLAGAGSPLSGSCLTGAEGVLGGFENTASGLESTVSGGEVGSASGGAASVSGGQSGTAGGGGSTVAGGNGNNAHGPFASILGGFENSATTFEASVSGGENNIASATASSVLGGNGNTAASNCQAVPAAPGAC